MSRLVSVNDPDHLRIGTKERDEALQVLGEHFTEGRLPVDDYDERITKALEATTRADLRPLFADLPPPHPSYFTPPPLPPAPPISQPLAFVQRNELVIPGERYQIVGGILQIMLPFGIGRFYLGYNRMAVTQLLLSVVGIGVIWCLIDGIILLVNGAKEATVRRPDNGPPAIR
ncbi:MAG: DUF1707 domain-containing protein [Kibdelosporangium sp.]